MSFQLRKAKRQRRPLKVSLEGLSGSGKTYTALRLAFAMRRAGMGNKIAVADSENSSAGLYSDINCDGESWSFDVIDLPNAKQNPDGYVEAYEFLVRSGYDIIVMDSLSHAWHGAQEIIDNYGKQHKGDKFAGWAQVTPMQRNMLQTLTDSRAHTIVTMRVKSEYERYEKPNGKEGIRKIGTKVDQREGTEYEFDLVLRLDSDHVATVEKVRGCTTMDGKVVKQPGPDFFQPLFEWWQTAEPELPPIQMHAKAIEEAESLDRLKGAFTAAWEDKRLTADEKAQLTVLKDERKAALAEPRVPGQEG